MMFHEGHTMKIPAILVLITVLLCPRSARAADTDPLKEGPYPVGVTTTVFVDESRTDAFTKKARTLVTEIWYPAADSARTMPKSKFIDFIPGGATPELDEVYRKSRGKSIEEI